LPWAEKLVAQRATTSYAEDLEARCLPGGPPRAAPYHTSLLSTPKLVLMPFEGNTHMYRQFFVDGSSHPKDLKPTLETAMEMTEYVCNENNQDPVHLDAGPQVMLRFRLPVPPVACAGHHNH
jgi:hypothetical protein